MATWVKAGTRFLNLDQFAMIIVRGDGAIWLDPHPDKSLPSGKSLEIAAADAVDIVRALAMAAGSPGPKPR
jgi:hypothetical protein